MTHPPSTTDRTPRHHTRTDIPMMNTNLNQEDILLPTTTAIDLHTELPQHISTKYKGDYNLMWVIVLRL